MDQIEKELLEGMELSAEEAFPKELEEAKKIRYTNPVFNPDPGHKYEYLKNPDGSYIYQLDVGDYRKALQSIAREFALRDIDINAIDWGSYKLEGIKIDRVPNDSIALIEYPSQYGGKNDHFLVIDKRKSANLGKDNLWLSNPRLIRDRDGKTVEARRIPDNQLLGKAKNIWIIPANELKGGTIQKQRDRAKFKQFSKFDRYEDLSKVPGSWYRGSAHLDKSGYLVDKDAIMARLGELKKKKDLSQFGDDLPAYTEKSQLDITSKFNMMAKSIMGVLSKAINSDRDEVLSKFSGSSNTLFSAKRKLLSKLNDMNSYLEDTSSKSLEEKSKSYSKKRVLGIISNLNKALSGQKPNDPEDYSWGYDELVDFAKLYKTALEVDKTYLSEEAFESIRVKGQLNPPTLIKYDNYIIPANILIDLEGK